MTNYYEGYDFWCLSPLSNHIFYNNTIAVSCTCGKGSESLSHKAISTVPQQWLIGNANSVRRAQ